MQAAGAAPASFDWREKGAVTPVRDQSACGSCWAFSTAENIEGQWAIAKKELVVLSPQDIVDCSHGCSPEGIYGNVCNSGCQGGWPWSAYMDIIKEGGIASDAAYPYTAVAGECAFKGKAEATAIISNYTCLPSDEAFIKDYLVSHGPLSVALDARFLMLYTGGVSNPPLCSQARLSPSCRGPRLPPAGAAHLATLIDCVRSLSLGAASSPASSHRGLTAIVTATLATASDRSSDSHPPISLSRSPSPRNPSLLGSTRRFLSPQEELDHAVLLVGYGTEAPPAKPSADEPSADKVSADPVDYWLVKNSWTAAWGEAGYFRIARGGNACGAPHTAPAHPPLPIPF